MSVGKGKADRRTKQLAVEVIVRFEQSGKIYPEIVSGYGQKSGSRRSGRSASFCGDGYLTPDRVFLVEYSSGTFHLFYIGQRWFVHRMMTKVIK